MKSTDISVIAGLGTILGVWAHPDDETFCAGGILAAASRNGQSVHCLTATRGEAGSQNTKKWPLKTMGKVRTDELQAALKILGVKGHHFLGYKDGLCADVAIAEVAHKIAKHIDVIQPDTILTFGPEGLTGHADHQAVSLWVDTAVEMANHKPQVFHAVITIGQYKKYLSAAHDKLNLFFGVDQPPIVAKSDCDLCFCCSDELCNCKYKAFSAMPSQYEKMQKAFDKEYLQEAFRLEAFVLAHK